MEKLILISDTKRSNLLIYLSSSLLLILVVSFIDEGANCFEWMNNSLDWISFFAYVVAIFLGQILFERKILKNYTGKGKIIMSILGGITVGLFSLLLVSFSVASIIL